jgi:hypothetical protein
MTRLIGIPLVLIALIGYLPPRSSGVANGVSAPPGSQDLLKTVEALSSARAALEFAVANEKLHPGESASRAVEAALTAYDDRREERLKAIIERRSQLEFLVRTAAMEFNIPARQLKEDPATRDLMAEHHDLTEEMVALSPQWPRPEVESNNELAIADRIIAGRSNIGVFKGAMGRGDVDFYSIEAEAGKTLHFSVNANMERERKPARLKFELLASDGFTKLLSFDGDTEKKAAKPLRFTVPESGKYFVRVKAASGKRSASYSLMVRQSDTPLVPFQVAGTTCSTFDFEGGADGFTVEPVFDAALWHLSTTCGAELPGHSTPTTFYYGIECNNGSSTNGGAAFNPQGSIVSDVSPQQIIGTCGSTCDYNTGSRNASNLVSPAVAVTSPATLTFNYLLFVEATTNVDLTFVEVSTDDGATWATVLDKFDLINDNNWHTATVDISPFVGAATSVRVRFAFDSVDSLFNNTTGWHVDDVQICGAVVAPIDTTPPTIDCPDNITAATPAPNQTGAIVTFPPPTASDDNPGVTTSCTPPSGSIFPVGTTVVTCTATDAAGNTATCSFTVTVFDVCLQDESSPNRVLLFNSFTGEYIFCCGPLTVTGKGIVTKVGSDITLQHNAATHRVQGKVSTSSRKGSAALQKPPGKTVCTINDQNIRNNTCVCGAPVNGEGPIPQ